MIVFKQMQRFLAAHLLLLVTLLVICSTGCAEFSPIVDKISSFVKSFSNPKTVTVTNDVDVTIVDGDTNVNRVE